MDWLKFQEFTEARARAKQLNEELSADCLKWWLERNEIERCSNQPAPKGESRRSVEKQAMLARLGVRR